MPDYYNGKDPRDQQQWPRKPRDYDEAAKAFGDNEQRQIEANKEEGRKYAAEQEAKKQAAYEKENRRETPEATQRRYQETAKAGPSERMVGNGIQNTFDRVVNITPPDAKLTAAQLEMKAKRETARQQDREVMQGKREPNWKPELPPMAASRNR